MIMFAFCCIDVELDMIETYSTAAILKGSSLGIWPNLTWSNSRKVGKL